MPARSRFGLSTTRAALARPEDEVRGTSVDVVQVKVAAYVEFGGERLDHVDAVDGSAERAVPLEPLARLRKELVEEHELRSHRRDRRQHRAAEHIAATLIQ